MKEEKRKNRIQWKKLRMALLFLAVIAMSVFRLPVVKGEAHSHSNDCYAGSKHVHDGSCGVMESDCVVCSGTGEQRDHVAVWQYTYSSGGLSCWKSGCGSYASIVTYTCTVCSAQGSIVTCVDCGEIENTKGAYCSTDCLECGGDGKVDGLAVACTNGCVKHDHFTADCFPRSYFTRMEYRLRFETLYPGSSGTYIYCRNCSHRTENPDYYVAWWDIYCERCDSYFGHGTTESSYVCERCGTLTPKDYHSWSGSLRNAKYMDPDEVSYYDTHYNCTKTVNIPNCGKENGVYYKGNSICSVCSGKGYLLTPPCTIPTDKYLDANGDEVGPICEQIVTNLEPANKTQTITAGQSPNVSAAATFLDGHTDTVTCSYTGFNPNLYNTAQTVTLSYGNYHDTAKNPGAKTCTITVIVQGYFNLTVSSAQQGLGTATGGGSKLTGSTVTVNATPSGSNRFTGWYEGATLVSTQASYRFTMPARNVTLVAHFIRIPVSLTVVPDKNMVYNGSEPSYAVTVEYSDGSSVALSPLQYTKSGFTKGTGIKTVSFSYTESGVTVTTAISVTVIRNTRTCKHGHIYELSDNDTDEGCSKCATTLDSISAYPSEQVVSPGGTPNFLVTGTYLDGHSVALYGWTTNFNSSGLGVQYVTITYGGQTCQAVVKVVKTFTCGVCGTVYEANEDLSNPGCPECRRSCVSIAVSPTTQMVEQGSPINITVVAKFRDGHTAEVTDWSSNYRPYTIGKQQVAVVYGGRTASVEVEVVAKKAVCINCGTAYDPMQGWCPNCGHILSAIRASTLDGSNLVIRGSRPELKVYGIYLDGHEERLEGGYTYSGLDIYTTGVQNVTVMYGGFSCSVTVTVLDSAGYNMCEKGHVYQLNSDGRDPGCPYCSIDEDDKTEKFYTTSYTDEIIGQMYRDGVYYLKDGDAVTITVKRQEKSGIAKLFDWVFRRFRDALNIKAGGIVGE